MVQLISQLREALQGDLPGQTAQMEMAHSVRQTPPDPPSDARIAAVLVLLFPVDTAAQDYHLVFIQRSSRNLRDRHAGQISFPGGSVEDSDPSLAFTALREAQEEVGVDPDQVEILGSLSTLYIPVSNFLVHPFVACSPCRPNFQAQISEVDAILELPLADFLQPTARTHINKPIGKGITLTNLPCWQVQSHQIWGATAMITNELLAFLR